MNETKVVVELDRPEEANQLYSSGEWGLPRYSDKRDKYVMVRLKDSALVMKRR